METTFELIANVEPAGSQKGKVVTLTVPCQPPQYPLKLTLLTLDTVSSLLFTTILCIGWVLQLDNKASPNAASTFQTFPTGTVSIVETNFTWLNCKFPCEKPIVERINVKKRKESEFMVQY